MQPRHISGFGGPSRHRKQVDSDTYCWACHRNNPGLQCTTCVRSFHETPACSHTKTLSEEQTMSWRCQECLDIEKGVEQNKTDGINAQQLKKVLKYIFQKLITDDRAFVKPFMNIDYPRGSVVNTMDLSTMEKKIEIGAYSCCEDFWADIKWIVHNTKIHCTADYDTIRAARLLYNTGKEETYSIRMCHECYLYDGDLFTTPCSTPHLLLWAKQRTFPYWPAKLVRYNSVQHTVDVLYFCENHLRAILPAKDCLLYSKQCPSVIIGGHKSAFSKAIKEAEEYIQNVTKKYGSFNYADAITPLLCNQLERHLYDTIPNAWKELGHTVVPDPIPKPTPASATVARRMSMPVQRTKNKTPPKVFTPGHIMTRRMSAILDGTLPIEEKKPQRATAYRRQSVQVDRLQYETIISSSVSRIKNAKDSTETTQTVPKKRRMSMCVISEAPAAKNAKIGSDASQKTPVASTINSTPLQTVSIPAQKASDSMFKVPPVPKIRIPGASAKNKLSQVKSTNDDLIATIDRDLEKMLSQSVQMAKRQNNQKTAKVSAQNAQTKRNQAIQPNVEHSTEMAALCKAVIDKDPKKVLESAHTSLTNMLINCLDQTNSNNGQNLQDKLEKQRKSYDKLVTDLRGQIRDLKMNIKKLKGNDDSSDIKRKFNVMATDLAKSQAKLADANDQMASLMTKNAFLIATNTKLHTTNIEYANNSKSLEAKYADLVSVNKNMADSNGKLNATIDTLSTENQRLVSQLKDQLARNESMKHQAYEHYARLMTDVKKKQWCGTCGMPGGQYFCSEQCKNYMRTPYYR